MSAAYTEGLLYADKNSDNRVTLRCKDTDYPVATDLDDDEDARRLVACWNAFDGVPTDKIEGKSAAEYIANEAYITGLVPVAAGGMELGLSGDACQLLAEGFAGQFKGSGGINFIEVQMSHKDIGPFTVTIQRQHGETPAQQKAVALAQLDAARTLLNDALETFDEYLQSDHEVADRIRTFLKGGGA